MLLLSIACESPMVPVLANSKAEHACLQTAIRPDDILHSPNIRYVCHFD